MRVLKRSTIYFGATLLLVLSIFAVPYLVLNGPSQVVKPITDAVAPKPQISKTISFTAPHHVGYNVERVTIDNKGASLSRGGTTAELLALDTVRLPEKSRVVDFIENADVPPGTSITYHVSANSQHWLFHDGNQWKPVGECKNCANTATELASKLSELSFDTGAVRLKAILSSVGTKTPFLRSVDFVTAGEAFPLPLEIAAQNEVRTAFASQKDETDECDCEGKVTMLTFAYNGAAAATVTVEQKKPETTIFDATVNPGETFTVIGADKSGTLGTEITIKVNGFTHANIHTSCSQPVEIGMSFGDFTITYGESRVNGPLCPLPPPDNQPPTALDDEDTTSVNTPVTLSVIDNDSDPEGDLDISSLVLLLGTGPSNGQAEANTETGEVTYTPDEDYVGTDSFDYEICDDEGLCDDATVTISIDTDEWDKSSFEVSGECDDPNAVFTILNTGDEGDGDMAGPSEYRVYRNDVLESTGTFQINGQETFEVEVAANGDSIKLEVDQRPGHPGSSQPNAVVEDCGTPACNLPPVAVNDEETTDPATPVTVVVLDNDYDPDGDLNPSTVEVISSPTNGSTSVNSANGEITYSPNPGFIGVDSFDYLVCDYGNAACGEDDGDNGDDDKKDKDKDKKNDSTGEETSLLQKLEEAFSWLGINTANAQDAGEDNGIEESSSPTDYAGVLCDTATVVITVEEEPTYYPVRPILECVDHNPDGSFTAHFGYENENPTVVNISHGDNNFFSPEPEDRGQPTAFDPGRTPLYPNAEFTIDFSEGTLMWTLTGPDGGTRTATATQNLEQKCPEPPWDNSHVVVEGECDCEEGCDSSCWSEYCAENKLLICHYPPGEQENVQELCVNESAIGTHQDHGDYLGACDPCSCPDGSQQACLEGTSRVVFTITNEGEPVLGDMAGPVQYRIYRNGLQEDSGTVQLDGGESTTVIVDDPNGDDISIQVDQRPSHPTGTPASDEVEDCGSTPELDPPVAIDDSAETLMNVPVDINILSNDYDPDGYLVPSTVVLVSSNSPDYGSVSFNSTTGEATYTPNTGYYGSDDFDYRVCDNDGLCAEATVTITINADDNEPPVAVDDSETTPYNTPVVISLLDNDYDTDGVLVPSSTAVLDGTGPNHGVVEIDSETGDATYTPDEGFAGTDSFQYEVCDDDGACDSANVTIVVLPPPNLPPVAEDDEETTVDCTPIVVDVLDNDYDLDGFLVPSSVTVTVPPTQGTTEVNLTTGEITYSVCGYEGVVTFEYEVCDDDGACDTATVTITVTPIPNLPPVAVNDSDTTLVNTPVIVDVLDNDYDLDGFLVPSSVFVLAGTGPSNGSTEVNATTGEITYTPDTDFVGVDQFNYRVCDNDGACDPATVTITIGEPPNLPPVAVDDSETTLVDTPVIVDVLDNDYDLDGYLMPDTVSVTSDPSNGQTSVNSVTGEITYTPDTGYTGSDSFDYEVCDNDGECDTATVTITIEEIPNLPPVALNDSETTLQNTPVVIALLSNDYDLDGYLLPSTVEVLDGTGPSHGSVTINPVNGDATYTPDSGYVGSDTFDYEVCDNDGACDPATVTIVIELPENDPPVAVDDSETTPRDVPVSVDVLDNDYDIDGYLVPGSVTVQTGSGPDHGSTEVDSETGEITYTPDTGYTGTDSFDYEVCDDDGLCDTATVTITVYYSGPENNPPVAVDDDETTDMDVPVSVVVLLNDFDTDGFLVPATVRVISGSGPSDGDASVDSVTGEITYTPDTGYIGTDSFDYEVCDDDGACDTATVTITIYPPEINEPPIAEDDSARTRRNTPVTIVVLNNDSDSDGVLDPTTVELIPGSGPSDGTAVVNPVNGTFTYTPDPSFVGNDTFDYRVCDDDGLCDTATVTVTVYFDSGPRNLPPIANDDGAATRRNVPVEIPLLDNDYDQDGILIPSTTIVLTQSAGVTININASTGEATYTPAEDFVGTDQFTYQVCDNDGSCDSAVATVTISDPNNPRPIRPIANDDEAVTDQGVPVEIDILANDSDPDGYLVPETVNTFNGPSNGDVVVNGSGSVTYTPNPGFNGQDTFEYEVCDNDSLCDIAVVTVNIRPSGRRLIPPVANADSITIEYESVASITVLVNDFDIDGYLFIPSLRILNQPTNGLATPSTVSGTITYLPDNGFSGIDTLLYEICDDDGLCDTALVTITVLPPFVPPPPPLPPEPPLPPAIPAIIIPIPEVPVAPSVIALNCGLPVHDTGDISFTGSFTGNLDEVTSIEYSLTSGRSWNAINEITTIPAGATFRFDLTNIPGGDYSIRARVVSFDGTRTTSFSSTTCQFTVDFGLVFGANQFILGAQPSPMADNGTVHFTLNQRHRFYMEAKGASEAYLRVIDDEDEDGDDELIFPLVWDNELKLWTGIIYFEDEGFYRLETTIANGRRAYTREINSVLVTEGTDITDIDTGEVIDGLTITVYEKEPASDGFQVWNAQAYAQSNPLQSDGAFAFVVPPGDFYVVIEHPDYDPITSLITKVPEQSVISANVQLDTATGFMAQFSRLFTRQATVNNFPLSVKPAPDTELLEEGNYLPNVNLTDGDGDPTTLYDQIQSDDRPTVVFVYSTWNTNAQMQIDIYRQVASKFNGHVKFVPVATMEPEQLKKTQLTRGAYGFEFFQPDDDFYDDFSIISLPAFYAVDSDRVLQGTLFGPRSQSALEDWVESTLDVKL